MSPSQTLRRVRAAQAFTLIELLVVILIIGILIAVAAPSFLGQTQKAEDSAAKQYLTVAYKAAKAYAVDGNGAPGHVQGNFDGFNQAVLQAMEPGMTAEVIPGGCPLQAAGDDHDHITIDTAVGDDLVICNDPVDRVWVLEVQEGVLLPLQLHLCEGGNCALQGAPAAASTVAASGGTVSDDGDYRVHTFNTSGSFVVSETNGATIEVLVVGGGGAGGYPADREGGGGGAGGLLYDASYTIAPGTYSVTVGAGGTAATAAGIYCDVPALHGADSVFGTLTAVGGGCGGPGPTAGGSGGGQYHGGTPVGSGALGTPGQGNAGGGAWNSGTGLGGQRGGGGGGAGSAGTSASSTQTGDGGSGLAYAISGSSVFYAGGGGGGGQNKTAGTAGLGGGGVGSSDASPAGDGAANSGGGGGGGSKSGDNTTTATRGGNGGSGVVIIRYLR